MQGDRERACEIEACARTISVCENSLVGKRVFLEPLDTLIAELDTELALAARKRGCARNVFDVASELLDEVQRPDWRWN